MKTHLVGLPVDEDVLLLQEREHSTAKVGLSFDTHTQTRTQSVIIWPSQRAR
jgi:hypothetical protein